VYIMSGFMQSIPKEVEESAVMDGCGIFGIIFKIMLPMTKPAIATICVLNFITWWNEFIMANTFLVSDEFKTLPFSIMKFTGQYSSNYGAQFAVMTLIAVPSIVMFIIFSKQMTKGITAGAVKG
jgi:raffinose/stachyose/melibiose transport system permease protein